jgi:hypothetical protein
MGREITNGILNHGRPSNPNGMELIRENQEEEAGKIFSL